MSAAVVAGLLAGYGIAVPVGAVAAYLVALTARTGLRVGAGAALGVATADGLYALLAVLGGTGLAGLIAPYSTPLRWVSAVVLVALAVRGATSAVRQYRAHGAGGPPPRTTDPTHPGRAFTTLLGITLLNPMTVVYFAALVLGGQDSVTPDTSSRAVFVAAAFAASASWQLLIAGGGALLGRALTGPRARLATALAASALITFLAARLLATGS
ncbi:LysE family transporter [Streptomyces sp. NPDC001941]|uniref:LysE family transporter n=1 Tax=Streptomyces sp. NPDC001941 TaxID=3154659 RepID=UPI00332D2AA9